MAVPARTVCLLYTFWRIHQAESYFRVSDRLPQFLYCLADDRFDAREGTDPGGDIRYKRFPRSPLL
jgi:hypothetical protein